MNRRTFLTSSLASAAALGRGAEQRRNHFLPKTDSHYRQVESYIEEVPVPEYHWASEKAYEAFRDIKYGVRLHWGLYSIKGEPNESWPFLKMPFAERQRYQELYKTWNPQGFNDDEKLLLRTARPAKGSRIRMLGTNEPLKWSSSVEGVEVQIPPGLQDESRRPCRFSWGFQIQETV